MNVVFWDWVDKTQRPVPVWRVAYALKVTPAQLRECLEAWAGEGFPEESRLQVEEKRYLKVACYGLEDRRGWISVVRPWGKSWRQLDDPSQHFTLEITLREARD